MSATGIYQDWLDKTSHLLMAGELDAIAERIVLPHRYKAPGAELLIETRDELLEGLRSFREALVTYGVNHHIRLAREAQMLSESYMEGIHDVHVLRNAQPVIPSYQDRLVLKRDGGQWKVVEIETALRAHEWPATILAASDRDKAAGAFASDDARRGTQDALALYQAYLDQIAKAVGDDDFEAFCDLQHFPYTTHGAKMDRTVDSPEDLRPFYEVLRRCHNGEVGDRIERIASRAEFISADRICGYHEGTAYLGDEVTVPTVRSCMILRRTGTKWRLQTVTNSIDNTQYPFSMYEPGDTLRTHLEVKERTKTWPTSH